MIYLIIPAYCFLGAASGGVISYLNRLGDVGDRQLFSVTTFFIWPFVWIGGVFYGVCILTNLGCYALGRSIGRTRHREKITSAKIRMMEEDMQRLNTNGTELMLRYDYRTCDRCFGSGCPQCVNQGVERVAVR